MYSGSIDVKQCLCYSQYKLLEKQKRNKVHSKATTKFRSNDHTLTIRHWFSNNNKPLFDGKVGDALYQLLRRFNLFCPMTVMIYFISILRV